MKYRHEVSAIISATSVIGGPLVVLGEVLERRAQSGSGLSPAEVQAAVRLVAAARHQSETESWSDAAAGTVPPTQKRLRVVGAARA